MTIVDAGPTLSELAARANRAHQSVAAELERVQSAASAGVKAALEAGEALLLAQERVPMGEWSAWLTENFTGSYASAQQYMRLAHYCDALPEADSTSIPAALRVLRNLPSRLEFPQRYPDEVRGTALKLLESGAPQAEVSELLGVPVPTVRMWQNPTPVKESKARQRQRAWRRKREREALERQERDAKVRKLKGPLAESYSLARRMAQALDQAYMETPDRDTMLAIKSALSRVYEAEDAIVRALKLS